MPITDSRTSGRREDCHDVRSNEMSSVQLCICQADENRSFLVNYTQTALQGPENAVVYIYCNYKDPQTHSELELLACIGKQLAEQAYSGFHIARDFARQVSAQKRDPLGDELVAFIKSLCALFRTVHILIDALVSLMSETLQ